MSDAELPSIQVTDEHLQGSKEQKQAIGSPTTEGGTSSRPRSATSSEGMATVSQVMICSIGHKSPRGRYHDVWGFGLLDTLR